MSVREGFTEYLRRVGLDHSADGRTFTGMDYLAAADTIDALTTALIDCADASGASVQASARVYRIANKALHLIEQLREPDLGR